MKLYNTATRQREEFIPNEPGKVSMYGISFCSHWKSSIIYYGGRS